MSRHQNRRHVRVATDRAVGVRIVDRRTGLPSQEPVVRITTVDDRTAVSVEFRHAGWAERLQIVRWVLNEARRINQMSAAVGKRT